MTRDRWTDADVFTENSQISKSQWLIKLRVVAFKLMLENRPPYWVLIETRFDWLKAPPSRYRLKRLHLMGDLRGIRGSLTKSVWTPLTCEWFCKAGL